MDKRIWLALGALVIMADIMLRSVDASLGFVLWVLLTAGALHFFLREKAHHAVSAWALLVFSLLPAIDVVQPLSVMIAILGSCAFAAILVGASPAQLWPTMSQVPFAGVRQTVRDVAAIGQMRPSVHRASISHITKDWAVPVVLGAVFLVLILAANPILQDIASGLVRFEVFDYANPARIVFWCIAAAMIWPALRFAQFGPKLVLPVRQTRYVRQYTLINTRSVTRALILFNAMFAVQTVLDLVIFTQGVSLPDGMTYATYAHRGAYPLLVTALLAGGFAIMAQPVIKDSTLIRRLLLIWVAQTVLLVASSLLRLDYYVDAYGLTYMRVAAFVWMVVVVLGLALMIWQIAKRLPVLWMIRRSSILGLLAVYLCAMTNIAEVIAQQNLAATARPIDVYYICSLGEGALPAIRAYEQAYRTELCDYGPYLSQPSDWREWGYRNFRLRSSLMQMQENGQ